MILFDESDLIRNDYNNTFGNTAPDYNKIRENKHINKQELYEVVWFCNEYIKNHAVPLDRDSFSKTELIIRLPAARNIIFKDELTTFVEQKWEKFLLIRGGIKFPVS